MEVLSDQPMRASLQVAPLTIQKTQSDYEPLCATTDSNPYGHSHITPPATPNCSEDVEDHLSPPAPPVFHNFLRAFYPFHPNYSITDSSVTIPLNEGEVVLVHSIHTNGWADGTLLVTGDRGWLPTNYCEAYDPEEMRNLLKALLNFWDLLRSTSVNDNEIFCNQEFMKGIIAGVRYLLERTNCLTREATIILRNDGLRRGRKSLLSELSSLVKTAKQLQECQRAMYKPEVDINDLVDEMILKAFKIVTKGVRFLDIFDDDRRNSLSPSLSVMATVIEESLIPPTPPAEQVSFNSAAEEEAAQDTSQPAISEAATDLIVPSIDALPTKRLSSLQLTYNPSHRLSGGSINTHRHSANISHRLSLSGHPSLSRPQNLISEQLSRTHDTLLSQLGSFIGRLHLQSQSRTDLVRAIRTSAEPGSELLAVVDLVCAHDSIISEALAAARLALYTRVQELISAGQGIIHHAATDDADVVMPEHTAMLSSAATGCVKAAGECVEKTKGVIVRIGDFESEAELQATAGIDLSVLDFVSEERPPSLVPSVPDQAGSDTETVADSTATSDVPSSEPAVKALPLLNILPLDKPLPDVPVVTSPTDEHFIAQPEEPVTTSRPSSIGDDNMSSVASSISSLRPTLPSLPKLSTSLPSNNYDSQSNLLEVDAHTPSFYENMTASSAGSTTTYLSRDSESSISHSSTRATTPDHTLVPKLQPSISDLSVTSSVFQADEVEDVESKLLERTYAHELMFNKEGLVTGGSLAALVERLTTHESTPDAMFVSTFYLTFRLFCTPTELADSLIDRFDYVGDAPHMAGPVRLRVYNVFKGWLESHWRDETDRDALDSIVPFAEHKLSSLIPSAGRRLLGLTDRVSSQGSLVPRLVSSMGKTNASVAQYVPAETPVPASLVTRSQLNSLLSWRTGGGCPTILDFDPLELARQLTIKQMGIFCSIMPEELLASQWMKNGGVDAPNVKAMSALSTDLSNLVAETILHYSEVKKRAAVIKQWIKIAHQLYELHNYDGLMAIICSLNSSTITRLRKTWDSVSLKRRQMLDTLQAIVEPSQNHKLLRGALHDHIPPCLPFLGMYLTDLTFVDIGNPATKQLHTGGSGDGEEEADGITVVNFDKHMRTAKIIGELQRFQIPYRLTEVPEMQEWMSTQIGRVRLTEPGNVQVTYYRKSLLLEPREIAVRPPLESTPSSASVATVASTTQRPAVDLFGWMSRDRQPSVSQGQ